MMKHYYLAALIAIAAMGTASCSQNKKQSAQQEIASCQVDPQDTCEEYCLAGTYRGTLPCADCGGKDVCLTISPDGTYRLQYKYQDKEEEPIEINGVYSVLDDELVETITPSSGEKTYYKLLESNLMLTDSLGTENEGELAKHYILTRDK